MLSRRSFLQASSLVALAPTVPAFLARSLSAAEPGSDERILVVIQLDGGNDGINTIVPYTDHAYAANRKELRLPGDQLIKIDDQVAWHPSMRAAADLLHDGRLAIVQAVGYPNPSRSTAKAVASPRVEAVAVQTHDQSTRHDQARRANVDRQYPVTNQRGGGAGKANTNGRLASGHDGNQQQRQHDSRCSQPSHQPRKQQRQSYQDRGRRKKCEDDRIFARRVTDIRYYNAANPHHHAGN